MKVNFQSKLPDTGTTIFSVMSQLAMQHNAINLSQGFPNFPVDPALIELVTRAMADGHNQYAPMQGLLPLREVIIDKVNRLYGSSYHPDTDITITAGATQAIFTAISAFIRPGDEVILFAPAYDCYEPAIILQGGKTKIIELRYPDYQIPWDEVKNICSSQTKMIIINTPHNPAGSILSEADMLQLTELTRGTDCIVLSDEVYEHIIFDGQQHQSAARWPELAERTFVIASFGKTFHCTGWKTGYCIAPGHLMKEFQKVHQFNVFCVSHPIQKALAAYLRNGEMYNSLGQFYQNKRDLFLSGIKGSGFNYIPTKGSYFQLLDYSNISREDDVSFAERLTKEFKVASIPVSVFYKSRYDAKVLRFCFAKTDETILQATEILSGL